MNEPRRLTVGSLFSGIGGIDLGFERAGMHILWQCEFDPFCRRVLRKHWPLTPCFEDVRELADPHPVDVLAGGYPCQPFSIAGRRRGVDDPRHLWPDFARLVGELRPRYVVGENVRGHTSKGLDIVLADLASMGYDAEWQVVSAAAVGAPHLRERVWIVAYANDPGRSQQRRPGADAAEQPAPERGRPHVADTQGQHVRPGLCSDGSPALGWGRPADSGGPGGFWAAEPGVGRVAHGLPGRVDRLHALGNAVVPQAAEYVGSLIIDHWRHNAPQDCRTAGR